MGNPVYIKKSHPDERIHGFVGEIIEERGHEVRVQFRLRPRNLIELETVWCNLRDIGPTPT